MSGPRARLHILNINLNMGIGGTEQAIRQLINGLPRSGFVNTIACIDGNVGEIGEQIQARGIDVVDCHQYTPRIYGLLAAIGLRARVIFTQHGRFHPDRYRYKSMLLNPLMSLMTDSIVAISDATKLALARYGFISAKRIRVIYNGIRGLEAEPGAAATLRRELGIAESELVLGTVARLDPVKSQTLMLDTFAILLKELPNSRLLMVGDGPDRGLLEKKAKDLGIDKKVIFTGFESVPVKKYLAAMDLFLLSSHTEGTSMMLLEAMSLGVPAIVTRVGGNPEIVIHGEAGLLAEPGSIKSFANAIKQLAADGRLREQLSRNSTKTFARAFSQERMIDSYMRLYDGAKGISGP